MWRYGSYDQVLQTIITNADTMEIYKKGDIMILPSGNLTELYKINFWIDQCNRSIFENGPFLNSWIDQLSNQIGNFPHATRDISGIALLDQVTWLSSIGGIGIPGVPDGIGVAEKEVASQFETGMKQNSRIYKNELHLK